MTKQSENQIKLRSFYATRMITSNPTPLHDFVQIGIWDSDYEYLDLEELKKLRSFLNETIMKMTFKTTIE